MRSRMRHFMDLGSASMRSLRRWIRLATRARSSALSAEESRLVSERSRLSLLVRHRPQSLAQRAAMKGAEMDGTPFEAPPFEAPPFEAPPFEAPPFEAPPF